jgi:hypothetical protein
MQRDNLSMKRIDVLELILYRFIWYTNLWKY